MARAMRTSPSMRAVGASLRTLGLGAATLACLVLESTCAAPQHGPHVSPAPLAMAPCPRLTHLMGDDDPAGESGGRAAIVIVLDGARWQEVFLGVDPALAQKAGAPAASLEAPMPHLRALAASRGIALGAPGSGGVSEPRAPTSSRCRGTPSSSPGAPPRPASPTTARGPPCPPSPTRSARAPDPRATSPCSRRGRRSSAPRRRGRRPS